MEDDKKRRSRGADDDRDDRRPDWRELDRRRDRSQHRGADKEPAPLSDQGLRRDYQVERYKKELDALFTGGKKPTTEQEPYLKKIRIARSAAINDACQEFVKKFNDLPRDWESCLLFLDATEPTLVLPALERLTKLFPEQTAGAQQNFRQRLRLLKMTTAVQSIRTQAEKLIQLFAV